MRNFALCLAFLSAVSGLRAQMTNVVDWGHTWSYMHPMGQFPDSPAGGLDLDFTNTWYQAEADFLTNYDGPSFGLDPAQVGVPATLNSYDSGSGPGPLGYEVINYFNSVGAEFTNFNTRLTQPSANNRRTAYFRTNFTSPTPSLHSVQLRYLMDDGAFVYLDGQLIATINIAAGVTDIYGSNAAGTAATEDAPLRVVNLAVAGVQGNANVLVPIAAIAPGTHTLAISARSNSPGSSDLCLAMQLRGNTACQITATPSNVVRSDGGSPNNPLDDTVTFSAILNGLNASSGWTTTVPPSAGAYGVTNTIGPVAVPANGVVTVRFTDGVDTNCFRDVTFNAPGCSMTSTAGGFVHNDAGTPTAPLDDTFTAVVTAIGTFGGSGWTSTTAPGSGAYGDPVTVGSLATTNVSHVITLRDNFTNTCSSVVTVHGPRLMGTSTLVNGAPRLIMDGAVGQNGAWVVSTNLVTTLNNAGNTNLNVRSTQAYDLSGVSGLVRLRARLVAQESSAGSNFETEDLLRVSLEIFDGMSTVVTNLTARYDVNGNGFMNGYSGADYNTVPTRDEFNLGGALLAGSFTSTFPLEIILPDSAQSIRLILEGSNNSATEFYRLDQVRLDTPFCEITAASAGAVTFNNQGDDDASNDTFSQRWTIRPIFVDTSTQWTSDATPSSGNYTDPQPVTFGPFPVSGGNRTVALNAGPGSGGCSTNFVVNTPPACSLTVTPAVVAVQENGPGIADDTFTIATTISNVNGGVTWTSDKTPASGAYGSVVFGPFPRSGGAVTVQIHDTAHPGTCLASVSGTIPARYVLGTVNLGSGAVDFGSNPAVAPPANWVNNAIQRTIRLNNGGAADRVVESQWIDLSAVSGDIRFAGTLAAYDSSAGSNFETADAFQLLLLEVVAGVTNTVNLTLPYDTDNNNGRINGYSGVTNAIHTTVLANYNANRARDEFNAPIPQDGNASISNNFAFVRTIADNVERVRLVVTGRNDSASEFLLVRDMAFTTAPVDSDGDFLPDDWEITHFGNIGAQSGAGDADGDGHSNYSEFVAQTNPTQPASVLAVNDPAVTGGNFSVSWPSVVGVRYQLLFAPMPLTATTVWQNLGTPVTATGTTTTANGTLPNTSQGYLQVQVVP